MMTKRSLRMRKRLLRFIGFITRLLRFRRFGSYWLYRGHETETASKLPNEFVQIDGKTRGEKERAYLP